MKRTPFVALAAGAAPGAAAPDHPAPVLTLTKAAATTATTATTVPAQEAQGGAVAVKAKNAASKSDVDTARTFGILGLVFGLLGFTSAIAAWRRRTPAS
jgi:hypothetical protein